MDVEEDYRRRLSQDRRRNDCRQSERNESTRSEGSQRSDRYIYGDRHHERSTSNSSRARDRPRHRSTRRSNSSDRFRHSKNHRSRHSKSHRSRHSKNHRSRHSKSHRSRHSKSHRSRHSKSHRSRYGSDYRHDRDKRKYDRSQGGDSYSASGMKYEYPPFDRQSTFGHQDNRSENESREGSLLQRPNIQSIDNNHSDYPFTSFLTHHYHQNPYPNNVSPHCHLQSHSNLVTNVPFQNPNLSQSREVEGYTSNTQPYVPYVPENNGAGKRLSYSSVYGFLDHILRSGLYEQPDPNTAETRPVDTAVESQPEYCGAHVGQSDFTAPKINGNSTENKTCDVGVQHTGIVDEAIPFLDINELFEMPSEPTTSLNEENQSTILKLSQAREKKELKRLQDIARKLLNDVFVSHDDEIIADQRMEVSNLIRPDTESHTTQDRLIEPRIANEVTSEKIRRKRPFNQIHDEDPNESMIPTNSIKNNNPEWHSLNDRTKCRICKAFVRNSLISHYVNVHPKREVFPSRVSPDVADILRNFNKDHKSAHQSTRITSVHKSAYQQFCYFCNESLCLAKADWIYHLRAHTGYYRYKCTECFKYFIKISNHVCKDKRNIQELTQPQFETGNIMAYLCDLCNYVRFDKLDIKNHLKYEHEGDIMHRFVTVTFLSFPGHRNRHGTINRNELNEKEMVEASKEPMTTLQTQSTALYANDVGQEKGEPKLRCNRVDENSLISTVNVKNIDPQCHSTNHGRKCKICKVDIKRICLVSHYVNHHPNSDVFPSRVAPDVGELLRKSKDAPKFVRIKKSAHQHNIYQQFCYFCNESLCLAKADWINHVRAHTGYYRYKCVECLKSFLKYAYHVLKDSCRIEEFTEPKLEKGNIMAYLCDLCNYVRLDKADIELHLKCEHEGDVANRFVEVTLLSFPPVDNKTLNQKKFNEESSMETSEEMEVRNAVTTLPGNQVDDAERSDHKKLEKNSTISMDNVKNIDPQCHSMNHGFNCKICRASVAGTMVVSHYANVHPNSDVFPSRVAPDVGDLLRKLKDVPKCEAIKKSVDNSRYEYKQFCYFCNESMWFPKYLWIKHMRMHSGYYTHKCTDCSKKFASFPSQHKCEHKRNIKRVGQSKLDNVELNLMAYLCDLCNYVRFDENDIQEHLKCEHEEDSDKYQEVIFLTFTESVNKRKGKQKKPETSNEEEIAELSNVSGAGIVTSTISTYPNADPTPDQKFLDESWETCSDE